MRNDYATTSAASPNAGQFVGEGAQQAYSRIMSGAAASNALSKPAEPPLLGEALDRLRRIRDGLVDGNGRIESVTDRVLGPVPVSPSSGSAPTGIAVADELLDLIRAIALQVERLHDVASRVERIG